ncbi:hypothetical protein [Sphaerisporangium corydalis]|uniref:Uncharacterized protein n=1 Tax=Sphaerisporangium corydalis TaxID=1441875 RepID=A0ABV9EDV8_9ACTN|nr:hypothetical protein [Sphaerisporangium corydalis]
MSGRLETVLSAFEGNAGHGVHVPRCRGTDGTERVTWYPATRRVDRARTLRWTCECRSTVYYLMAGGGLAWIRRIGRQDDPAGPKATETDHMTYPEAERLWHHILLGHAR